MCLSHTAGVASGAPAQGTPDREAPAREAPDREAPARDRGARFDRRTAMLAGAGAAAAALWPSVAEAAPPDRRPFPPPGRPGTPGRQRSRGPRPRMAELTHPFRQDFPVYTGQPPTAETLVTIADDGFYSQRWTFDEHTGTHVDAPGHFTPGGRLAPDLTPEELVVPAAVVDISDRAAADRNAEVTVEDLVAYERGHGRIPRGAAVLMNSGWDDRAHDRQAYLGIDGGGGFNFPGFSLEAAEWLLDRRDVTCLGVDTSSLDPGPSATFDVHVELLGADRYGIEGVANLDAIPPRGATVFVGLVPWGAGSGGPCRMVASW